MSRALGHIAAAYSLVPEGLELCGPVAVSGGDTEEETVVLLKGLGVGKDGVVGLSYNVSILLH